MEIRAASSPVLAKSGALYVRDWPDGTHQLHRYDGIAGPDRKGTKLTSFPDGMSSFSLSPDDKRLVVAAGRGGNEQDQLYVIDVGARGSAGPMKGILENPDAVFRLETWLKDGSGFVYAANAESTTDFYLYRYDFDASGGAGKSTKLSAKPGAWSALDVTRDGKRLLVVHFVSESNVEPYELDASTGELTPIPLTPGPGASGAEATTNTAPVGYLADETSALIESDAEGGTRHLWIVDLKSKSARRPLAALDRFELDGARIDDARTLCAVVTNEDGYGVLHLYRLPDFAPIELPPIERGVVTVDAFRNGTLVWTLSNARTPGLSFAWQVPARGSRGAAQAKQITFADSRGIDLAGFALPELVHYKSFDGLEIPAFLYLPAGHMRGTKIPFVVHYHGGPEGQHRPSFDSGTQAVVAHGFGVIEPNVRGSTGYGRAYQMLDDYKNRWSSVKDGVEAARWLVKQGYAEPMKIAASGGSYGGYMSVAATIEGKDVIGASVDVVGVVNMKTFLEQTKGYRRKLREAEYGPLSDPEFLASISPITRADEIEVPMLIAHGLNDPRVPVGEAMQLAVNLQQRGLDPELYFFPDEGHGFRKLENRKLFADRMVRFLERTIAKPGT
jgi:dipeptidyl aminopeptidase/acylaminoacyl peptidase